MFLMFALSYQTQSCFAEQTIVYEHRPETTEYITRTNVLQNRCYRCIQWTQDIYSVVIIRQSNPPISQIQQSL